MDIYNISYSEDTKIGAAYDEFHHEIAQVAKDDNNTKIEFRSKDYKARIEMDNPDSLSVLLEDNSKIKIFKENQNTYLEINGDKIDTSSGKFTLEIEKGIYNFYINDEKNLEIKTESHEIVLAIAAGLTLIAFNNKI